MESKNETQRMMMRMMMAYIERDIEAQLMLHSAGAAIWQYSHDSYSVDVGEGITAWQSKTMKHVLCQ